MTGLAKARERIRVAAERAGRDPGSITLLVVTKGVGVDCIRAAVADGAADLAENRVQEALGKQAPLGDLAARWHLIGHVQTNKAARAATAFSSVHTIDSERIAGAIGSRRPAGLPPLAVLIEVDLTSSDVRTGASPGAVDAIVSAVGDQRGLALRGLMTVAPQTAAPERRAAFARLRALRDDLEHRHGIALPDLSAGMSDDFEIAIEEGSTIVRLGRVIFGARPASVIPP